MRTRIRSIAISLLAAVMCGCGGGGGGHGTSTIHGVTFDPANSADLTRLGYLFDATVDHVLSGSSVSPAAGSTLTIHMGMATLDSLPVRTMTISATAPTGGSLLFEPRTYYLAADSSTTPSVWVLQQTGSGPYDFAFGGQPQRMFGHVVFDSIVDDSPRDPTPGANSRTYYRASYSDGYLPFGEGLTVTLTDHFTPPSDVNGPADSDWSGNDATGRSTGGRWLAGDGFDFVSFTPPGSTTLCSWTGLPTAGG
jgi:hypothetical protein